MIYVLEILWIFLRLSRYVFTQNFITGKLSAPVLELSWAHTNKAPTKTADSSNTHTD